MSTEMDNKSNATMDNKLYNLTATVQLCAHLITMDALKDCIARILESHPTSKDTHSRALRISDLGSSGGVNAIRLLRYIEKLLHGNNEFRPIEYIFDDLPESDFNELIKTIHCSNLSDQFYPMCIGKSFYEKLFPPNSIHLSLSYITLHWLRNCPDFTKYSREYKNDLTFVQPNEANVSRHIFEQFRASSIADLTLFLQLRAEELCDNGEGLYLMLGGGYLDKDDQNNHQRCSFIKGRNGSVYKEAFENAANDPEYFRIADKIKEAQLQTFIPYFLRSEHDVMESFNLVKDVLELKALKCEDCQIDCGSPEKLAELIWSIHGNAFEGSVKAMLSTHKSLHNPINVPINDTENLFKTIIEALKLHIDIITKRDFANGQSTTSYMYLVVKRKPRK